MKKIIAFIGVILCSVAHSVGICQNDVSLQVELLSQYDAYGESDGYDICYHLNELAPSPKIFIFGESITEGTYEDFLAHVPYLKRSEETTVDGQIKYIYLSNFDYGGRTWDFITLTFCWYSIQSVYKLYEIEFTMSDENTLANQVKQNQTFQSLKSRIIKKYTSEKFSWHITRFPPNAYCVNLMKLNSKENYDTVISIFINQEEGVSKGGEYRQYLTLSYTNQLMKDWYNSYTDDDF